MNFKEQYSKYREMTESLIEHCFAESKLPQKSVMDAMRYAVTGGGKRIRPVLVLAAAELCGADLDDAAYVALAVECIHNYSLIHDDLPCMDNDDLRHGRASCHVKFGEDIALLAGDGLLNRAFEILSDNRLFKSLTSTQRIDIIVTLSSASGALGMIGGQVVDLECENRHDVTLDELKYLQNHKTGALISASVRCGCLCGIGSEDVCRVLDKYAEKLGLAFQIKDDILDVIGDGEMLGKPIGSDEDCGKTTFVSLLGMEGAKRCLAEETNGAKDALKTLGERGQFFYDMAEFLLVREF